MSELPAHAARLLDFWFGEERSVESIIALAPRYWTADPAFDDRCRRGFGDLVLQGAANAFTHWERTPEGALALIVLLDQIPRNIYREDARAWAQDAVAREVCRRALRKGHDRRVNVAMRAFFYMPLMHSEFIEDHAEALARFEALELVSRGGPFADMAANNLHHQRMHTAWIARFGRYPHRNARIGRPSTPEELAFLGDFDAPG